jgi:F-type H+-transporting ATPase subunit delta
MAELSVVRRYARALFETAVKGGTMDHVEGDLKGVHGLLVQVPQFRKVLRAPTVSGTRKKALLAQTLGNRVSPLTLRMLNLLVDKRREALLDDLYPEFQRLADEYRNIQPVEVTAATPLTDQERDSLSRALAARTGKQPVLQVRVQPEILGGLVVRMGDRIIDGSVRTKLEQLRQRLLTGAPS